MICYHLHIFKNVKNTHEGVLLLVKLQAEACPWVLYPFFKLQKWYQIAQRATYVEIIRTFLAVLFTMRFWVWTQAESAKILLDN